MDLCDLSALELTQLLRQKKTSAVEILQSALQRIGSVDGRSGTLDAAPLSNEDKQKVHAFITLTDER
ncbi:MAG: Asp-tRNA(Asn)/Glu-tRNA(Gln) amidotransferase GatCAB subunit A, partial [Chloroflexi bacterium HGW-Chloroflexi-7]